MSERIVGTKQEKCFRFQLQNRQLKNKKEEKSRMPLIFSGTLDG